MKRIIDHFLMQWKENRYRKPLLLRGARQVGKTYAVRALGATYPHFVEINLEERPDAHGLFDGNIDPHNIIPALSLIAKQQIIPGKTLLFIVDAVASNAPKTHCFSYGMKGAKFKKLI